jgi:predicted nucleic acid-binding protein
MARLRRPSDAAARAASLSLVSEAEFLITGDRDFAQAEKLAKTTIISISLFKKLVCDTAS